VGEIVAVEPISGSDRLLAVTVDLGREQRRLVAGVGQAFGAEQLMGLRVVVAANLAPATIRGIESQGMLLGVGCDDPAGVALLTVNRAVANGAEVV
jgi:methionyl-tRNA synthetase